MRLRIGDSEAVGDHIEERDCGSRDARGAVIVGGMEARLIEAWLEPPVQRRIDEHTRYR